MAEIEFIDVQKIYDDGTQAVFDLNLEINDGELMVLVGPVRLRQDDRAAHGRGARGDLATASCESATAS